MRRGDLTVATGMSLLRGFRAGLGLVEPSPVGDDAGLVPGGVAGDVGRLEYLVDEAGDGDVGAGVVGEFDDVGQVLVV